MALVLKCCDPKSTFRAAQDTRTAYKTPSDKPSLTLLEHSFVTTDVTPYKQTATLFGQACARNLIAVMRPCCHELSQKRAAPKAKKTLHARAAEPEPASGGGAEDEAADPGASNTCTKRRCTQHKRMQTRAPAGPNSCPRVHQLAPIEMQAGHLLAKSCRVRSGLCQLGPPACPGTIRVDYRQGVTAAPDVCRCPPRVR